MGESKKENCCLACHFAELLFTGWVCTMRNNRVDGFNVCNYFTERREDEPELKPVGLEFDYDDFEIL